MYSFKRGEILSLCLCYKVAYYLQYDDTRGDARHNGCWIKQPANRFFFQKLQHYKQPTRPENESDRDKKGKQINSWFSVSANNDKIKHIYGNYNFWSWFRFWYVDNVYLQTLMIIDKGYYDYDHDNTPEVQIITEEEFNNKETAKRFASMGIGTLTEDNI